MAKSSSSYSLPADATGEIRSGGLHQKGTLAKLLNIYCELSEVNRKRAVIMLDKPIPMPPEFTRKTAINLFDGEPTVLIRYLDPA